MFFRVYLLHVCFTTCSLYRTALRTSIWKTIKVIRHHLQRTFFIFLPFSRRNTPKILSILYVGTKHKVEGSKRSKSQSFYCICWYAPTYVVRVPPDHTIRGESLSTVVYCTSIVSTFILSYSLLSWHINNNSTLLLLT